MSNKRTSMENGLTFGIIVLAVVIIFAVGLPRWHKNADAGVDNTPISLPDTVAGSFLAADSATAWSELKSSGKVTDQQVQQLVSEADAFHGQNATDATNALGVTTAGRYYVSKDGNVLSVYAARGSSTAWFPGSGGSYTEHGDVTCYAAASSSSGSTTYDCRRTSDDLTVEVTSQGVDADATAAAVDEVFNGISG